jgi:hypothetical protein
MKYPKIKVKLVGKNGNAFAVMGLVAQAMRKANLPKTEIDQFHRECMAGDYDNLLRTCCEWVDVS